MTFERKAAVVGAVAVVFWVGFAAGHADPEPARRQTCVAATDAVDRARLRLDGYTPCEEGR
jgi:hypothetical protein